MRSPENLPEEYLESPAPPSYELEDEVAHLEGFLSLRVLDQEDLTDESQPILANFEPVYFVVEKGIVRWFKEDTQETILGCGCLFSYINLITPSTTNVSKSISLSSSGSDLSFYPWLQFEIQTSEKIRIIQLQAKNWKLWQLVLELHTNIGEKIIKNLPISALNLSNFSSSSLVTSSFYTSQSVDLKIPVVHYIPEEGIQSHQLVEDIVEQNVSLSLLDDIDDIYSLILENLGINEENITDAFENSIFIPLLRAQRELAINLLPFIRKIERENDRLKFLNIVLEKKLTKTERNNIVMMTELSSIEDLLNELKLAEDLKVNTDLPTAIPSPSNKKSKNEEAFERLTAKSSSITNWREKYNDAYKELTETKKLLAESKQELKRYKKESTSISNYEILNEENRKLREMSSEMRDEVLRLQAHIEEIEESAKVAFEFLKNNEKKLLNNGTINEENQFEDQFANEHMNEEVPSYHTNRENEIDVDHTLTDDNDEYYHMEPEFDEYKRDDKNDEASMGIFDDNSFYGDGILAPHLLFLGAQDHDNWTLKYQEYLQSSHFYKGIFQKEESDSDIKNIGIRKGNSLLRIALQSIQWPLIEDKLIQILYHNYTAGFSSTESHGSLFNPSNSRFNSMTMTRFFKFVKDFHIINDDSPSSSIATNISNIKSTSSKEKLIYGEVSVIFANASRLETNDIKKKQKVFNVKSLGSTYASNSSIPPNASTSTSLSTTSSSVTTNMSGELSLIQFKYALSLLGEKLYSKIIDMVLNYRDKSFMNINHSEKKLILRSSLELLWLKVLLPHIVTMNIIPWSLIFTQKFILSLSSLPRNIYEKYLEDQAEYEMKIKKINNNYITYNNIIHMNLPPKPLIPQSHNPLLKLLLKNTDKLVKLFYYMYSFESISDNEKDKDESIGLSWIFSAMYDASNLSESSTVPLPPMITCSTSLLNDFISSLEDKSLGFVLSFSLQKTLSLKLILKFTRMFGLTPYYVTDSSVIA